MGAEDYGKRYITDIIGEEYRSWKPKDIIEITAPTGSGKTSFILKTLLPYAVEKNLKILYLVNRKVLKSQLEKEVDKISIKMQCPLKNNILIRTYQSIEENRLEKF